MFGLFNSSAKPSTSPSEINQPAQVTQPDLKLDLKPAPTPVDNKKVEELKATLHQAPTKLKNYKFRKISSEDSSLAPDLQKILKRHSVFLDEAKYKYNNAVISDDGNKLVLAVDGKTLLKNYYGGTNSFMRFFNSITGFFTGFFGARDKFVGTKRYRELYNQSHHENPDGEKGETLEEFRKGLYDNHYHGTVVYEKDPATGDFEKSPKIIGITDAYMFFVRQQSELVKENATEEDLAALEQRFKKYYSLDKVIPLFSLGDKVDFDELRHVLIEGLYQAQGFDFLAVPGKIDTSQNSNTNDLNYLRMNWNNIRQLNNGEWKILKEAQEITFVRPLDKANEPIPQEVAALDASSQVSTGSNSRVEAEDYKNLFKEAAKLNQAILLNQASAKPAA